VNARRPGGPRDSHRLSFTQEPTRGRPSPFVTRWNIPDGLTEGQRYAPTNGSPNAPAEYSSHDIRDHISSPTRRTNHRQNCEMIFHPSRRIFAFFFHNQPHSQLKNAPFTPLPWNKLLYSRRTVFPRPSPNPPTKLFGAPMPP
jgi:hypothetical protein